jgi:hypothetical protein
LDAKNGIVVERNSGLQLHVNSDGLLGNKQCQLVL